MRDHAAVVDDPAAFLHVRGGCLNRDKRAAHIDGEHPVESIECEFVHRAAEHDASIVHENIEAAQFHDRAGDGSPDFVGIGVVRLNGEGLAPGRGNFGCNLVGFVGRGGIGERHDCTICRETTDDRGADAARSAGNKSHFSGQ
ncbi:MAG: hypothetical protein ABF809_09035 [Gluconobacter potus]